MPPSKKHRHTAYIFAGSKTQMLAEMIIDPNRPFYRFGSNLSIGKIPKSEFTQFLVDKFTKGGFFLPKTVLEEKRELAILIIELADGVPYNVQMLAHFVWNNLSILQIGASEKAYLSEKIIRENLDKITSRSDTFYTQVWNSLTANQKKAIAASCDRKRSEPPVKRNYKQNKNVRINNADLAQISNCSSYSPAKGKEWNGHISF